MAKTREGPQTVDLSVPENQQWTQEQWDQLVITNEWLRNRELFLIQEISELRKENAVLKNRLAQQ